MALLSYSRHRFPPAIIQHAIWLYLRFTLSYRDVEEILAERGLEVSYETVRRWVLKFGPLIARKLRQGRPRPSERWHLDEMVVRIAGKRMYLWRAVGHEGEILDMLVQGRRDTQAALRLMRKLLKKQGFAPKLLVTDKLGSYRLALRQLRLTCPHERDLRPEPNVDLKPLYEQLSRQAILTVKAEHVATFLGHKITAQLAQEIGSQFTTRIEGTCVRSGLCRRPGADRSDARSPSPPFDSGHVLCGQVRSGLSPGGRWIRTFGSAR
jgi:transposase-like protein